MRCIALVLLALSCGLSAGAQGSSRSRKADTVFKYADQMPAFPGDMPAFLSANLKYPELPVGEADTKVVAKFVVRKDGTLTNVEIVDAGPKALEQEVLRLIGTMPRWIPGRKGGVAVDVEFLLPIILDPAD